MQRELGHKLILRVCALAVMSWAIGGSVQASILLPKQTPFNLDRLLAASSAIDSDSPSAGSSAAGSSGVSSSARITHRGSEHLPQPLQGEFHLSEQLLLLRASAGGSTSGTSSTSGANGTTVFPFDSAAPFSLADQELVAWVCGERSFALPSPPGRDLLRPPQAA